MIRHTKRIWLAVGAFIAILILSSSIQLAQSYDQALDTAAQRVDLPGYLVSEWISQSFETVGFILKETLADFNAGNLMRGNWNPQDTERIDGELARRAAANDHMVFLGVFDDECVVQFGSIPSTIGDDAIEMGRSYCQEVQEPPVDQLKLSGFFVSSTGALNVSVTYPLVSENAEVGGFALAGLDLSFFQRWLDELDDPSVTLTLMDDQRILLARKPGPSEPGQVIEDQSLSEFLASSAIQESFRRNSPVDGVERIWSLRRIGQLPLVIASGYEISEVLSPWFTQLATHLVALVLLATASILLGFSYHKNQINANSMELLAMKDQLTGLMNRRSFSILVRTLQGQYKSSDEATAFIMMDVDHFKGINDSLGHEAGDTVLKELASVIRSSFRASDHVCRWGGEEFLACLPGAGLSNAFQLAQRLKDRMAMAHFSIGQTVTISVGVTIAKAGETMEQSVKRADQMLYLAKKQGRNMVCCSDPDEEVLL